jgi:hypothetical protein
MKLFSFLHNYCFALLILFIGYTNLFAQVKVLSVMPSETDPAISTIHGPNLAVYNSDIDSHQLILMIVGTGGKAAGSRNMDSIFASLGYHVISLDYNNKVIAVICAHSKDSTCFDNYRKEIITGTPVSSEVNVDSTNSILNRFKKMLLYLGKNYPAEGWNQYIKNGNPVWQKIIAAGHSQGAGHAAYLGKMFKLDRVLMFSGPQDYMDSFQRPAAWEVKKGATPPNRYFAFLQLKDPFNIQHQIANCDALLEKAKADTLMIHPGLPIKGKHHILITDIVTKHPHGSTLFPVFKNVWKYMLTSK